jgi:hypothetical protein
MTKLMTGWREMGMKKVRCHVTGRMERSKRCRELRKYLGLDTCPRICGRLPYGFNQYFQSKTREEKLR